MTTLALDANRVIELGEVQEYPVIASDIVYEGAAVGLVDASGHARPLNAADKFAGFAERQCDNSSGGAAAKTVRVRRCGEIQLSVSGAVITDVGQPVYATDDDTFVFSPVGGVFIGKVARYVSAGVVIVAYDVGEMADPYGAWPSRELMSANTTLDIQDNGKLFWVDTDGVVVQMPAVATVVSAMVVNGGAFGAVGMSVSPNASDKIQGPDIAGTDDHDLVNTKATARRGDFAQLMPGDANGPSVRIKGTWATA